MPAVELMGHTNCLGHLPCVTQQWFYNPSRCSACIAFYNNKFVGASSLEAVEEPRKELERLINRVKRQAEKDKKYLSLHQVALSVRRRDTTIAYFQTMTPLVLDFARTPTEEFSSSSASVASTSGTSKHSSPSHKSEKTNKLGNQGSQLSHAALIRLSLLCLGHLRVLNPLLIRRNLIPLRWPLSCPKSVRFWLIRLTLRQDKRL